MAVASISRSIHTVLVVDDDERVLTGWKRSIGRDRTPLVTSDPVVAKQLVRAHAPDLAIVDMRLGTTSGIELVRDLKRERSDMLAVLCSGYLSVDAAVAAMRAGADMVVFKPVTFAELLRKLDGTDEEIRLDETPTLARAEWEHIMRVLADCNGNVTIAAQRLGMYRSTLQRRLRKYAPRK